MTSHRPLLTAALAALPLLVSCAAPAAGTVVDRSSSAADAVTAPAMPPAAPQAPWLTQLIAELQQQPISNPPASIVRYEYDGRTVYYLPPKCCDFPSVLLDADGHKLCSPDGGITGRGDQQCPDFREARSQEQLIWKDARKREPRR